MKISSVVGNYIQKTQKLSVPKISFGEYDGDYYDYSPRKITKEQYKMKEEKINKKYDQMRSSCLNDCDDLEISNSAIWNILNQIERLRDKDLEALRNEYRV